MKSAPLFLAIAIIGLTQPITNAKEFTVEPETAALWNFNEGIGDMTNDEANSGINFRFKAGAPDKQAPEWVDGKFGKAIHFSGGGYLLAADKGLIETPTEVTLEAWIKIDPAGKGRFHVIFKNLTDQQGGFSLTLNNNNRLVWVIGNGAKGTVLQGTTEAPLDEWIHVAATYDGTTMRIFINGSQDAELTVTDGQIQSEAPPMVGFAHAGSEPYFLGEIDSIRISKKAFTEFDLQ